MFNIARNIAGSIASKIARSIARCGGSAFCLDNQKENKLYLELSWVYKLNTLSVIYHDFRHNLTH